MKILHRCWKYASHTVGNSRWFCRAVDSQILDDGITLFLDGLLWLLHCRRKIQGGQNPGKVLEQKIHFQGQIQMQHQKYPKSRNTGHYVWVVTISVDLNKAGKLLHVSSPAWGRRISRKAGQHENPRKLPWPDKNATLPFFNKLPLSVFSQDQTNEILKWSFCTRSTYIRSCAATLAACHWKSTLFQFRSAIGQSLETYNEILPALAWRSRVGRAFNWGTICLDKKRVENK